ncbi:Uma2 family endonuclease [Gemmata sp. G18]|uniref:Uma2 family endonuclease n=1 Tax=Gemmata palustris TaxID=2822762 RepID=A0ABS5BTM3_9BACT|nr:Uma2 family endonuclease [Gemmata palustris]MBP3956645.1 Uma2 family endonuclease [Gemmata palustris]
MATATEAPYSFAELHARLGGIPLNRIRMQPPPSCATESDLERAGKPICELIDGVLVDKPMGTFESFLGVELSRPIANHVEANDLGVTLGEAGFIRLGPDQVRAPDVTFIPWGEFPNDEIPADEAFWTVAPGLIVEVLSPGNTTAEIDRKLAEFFAVGCKLAWTIDPRAKTARAYTSVKKFKELDEAGILDGGKVLPGFTLGLADLFASVKRKKKKPR